MSKYGQGSVGQISVRGGWEGVETDLCNRKRGNHRITDQHC